MSDVYLRLTSSQLMALRSLLSEYIIGATPRSEVFVDCSVQPSVDTTPEELLSVLLRDRTADLDEALKQIETARERLRTYGMNYVSHDPPPEEP